MLSRGGKVKQKPPSTFKIEINFLFQNLTLKHLKNTFGYIMLEEVKPVSSVNSRESVGCLS